MAKKTKNNLKENKSPRRKLSRKAVIPIVISSILVVILIFAAVFGIIAAIREKNAAASYRGVTVSRGVAAYLSSTYKNVYVDNIPNDVIFVDTAKFWISEKESGVSWGADLERQCEEYVRSVVVRAALFDRYAKLTRADRDAINKSVSEVLDSKADGSVDEFNRLSEGMGFNFKDFSMAAELLYKAERALTVIYGSGGANLAYVDNMKSAVEYLQAAYTRVEIMFIRKNERFARESGQIVYDENGEPLMVELSDEEKSRRLLLIAELKEKIDNIEIGSGAQMSPQAFATYYREFIADDPTQPKDGYYLNRLTPSSGFTAAFSGDYPEVTEAALGMEIGEFSYVDTDEIAYFIYRTEIEDAAYVRNDNATFFGDFYARAAVYHLDMQVAKLIPEVKLGDPFYDINPRYLQRNYLFLINE